MLVQLQEDIYIRVFAVYVYFFLFFCFHPVLTRKTFSMMQTFDNFVLNVILITDILFHMIQEITKKKAKCTFLHKKQMYLPFVFYPCFFVSLILKKKFLFIYKLYSKIYLHRSSYIARRYIFSRYFFQHYASILFAKQLVKLSSS